MGNDRKNDSALVNVVCKSCGGHGIYKSQETCIRCDGEGDLPAELAPGERDRIIREAVAAITTKHGANIILPWGAPILNPEPGGVAFKAADLLHALLGAP